MPLKKTVARHYRKERVRKKIFGTPTRPRLSVYKGLNHFYAQVVDDLAGKTLVGVSTRAQDFSKDAGNVKGAKALGKILAEKVLEKKIDQVVFDRGGFPYHVRVKAFAEGAREGGLKF